MPADDPILKAAHRLLGYESLRPGQREAIQSLLDGRDTLAVLATGAGKSAIYELAGPLLGGPTVVVSPLLALQRDQTAALEARGHAVAVALNSSETSRQRQQILGHLAGGDRPDFVFLAPEQLANGDVLAALQERAHGPSPRAPGRSGRAVPCLARSGPTRRRIASPRRPVAGHI